MKEKIFLPSSGESITHSEITVWLKKNGDYVNENEIIAEVETEKATLDVNATASGKLEILIDVGAEIEVGKVIANIDTDATQKPFKNDTNKTHYANNHPSPSAHKKILSENINIKTIESSGKNGRILKQDLIEKTNSRINEEDTSVKSTQENENKTGHRLVNRKKMTNIRKVIANKLLQAKEKTAMLTTFNEVDMSAVIDIRKEYKEIFKEKHNINLGFMSFFIKAICSALKEYPIINASVDGEEILHYNYMDIGVAVSTSRGLIVPVIRNAQTKSFSEIETSIANLAQKGREGKLSPDDIKGGTFTITNGGIFGSMLSTPLINYPQSAILGMHNIVKRTVVINDKIEIRPIMYLALSYDHRIIDGADSVQFLYHVKQSIENPSRILIGV